MFLRTSVVAGLIALWTIPLTAQTSCRGADQTSRAMIAVLARYATAEPGSLEAEARDSLRIPKARPEGIALVVDQRTCGEAATAYRADLRNQGGRGGFTDTVYVVRIGTRQPAYLVHDPGYLYHSAVAATYTLFDHHWRRLSYVP